MKPLSAILVALTFLLIFWGGQVTTTDSGDSVPPWPASFFWPKNMPQVWELGHRWLVIPTTLVSLALCVAVLRHDRRPLPRRLSIAAVVIVLVQALIGGFRVLSKTKDVKAVVHAMIAQAFLATAVAIACAVRAPITSADAVASPEGVDSNARWPFRRAVALAIMTWIQTGLGAVLRHETRAHNKIGLVLHLVGAFLVIVFAIRLIVPIQELAKNDPRFRTPGRVLALVLVGQLMLGLAAWTTTHTDSGYVNPTDVSSLVPTLHVVVGALFLSLSVMIAMRARVSAPALA